MVSLVKQLQRDAIDNTICTSDLLRKALIVARKLKIDDYVLWINAELNANWDKLPLPSYRKNIRASIKVKNPYHGLQPLRFKNANDALAFSQVEIRHSIIEIEDITREHTGQVEMELPADLKHTMMTCMEITMEPCLITTSGALKNIIDQIRTNILSWAINLEAAGILGDDIQFSEKEIQNAASTTIVHIHGTNNQLQINSPNSSQELVMHLNDKEKSSILELCDKIKQYITESTIPDTARLEAAGYIDKIIDEAKKPKGMRSIVIENLKCLSSNIFSQVAATEIVAAINHVLGNISIS